MIPCTTNFTKEILLDILEAKKFDLKQSRELTKVEIAFSALSMKPGLARSTKVQGDIASNDKSMEEKIQEGVALLVKREKYCKNIFKCWTCNEYGHYASKCPKRERKYKGRFKSRRPRNFLYANEEEDEEEFDQNMSEDELGFVTIKEDDLDREIREESALISQVEKKYWIIDSGCSYHMIGDMSKFVKFRSHDGGIVRVGNNVAYTLQELDLSHLIKK